MTNEEVEALVLTAPCAELLGRRLVDHDDERGWIKFEFEGKAEFLNPAGRVQGGFVTAMLDDTMGPAVLLKSGGTMYPSSIDMNVSFLSAAKPGPLFCEGEVCVSANRLASFRDRWPTATVESLLVQPQV